MSVDIFTKSCTHIEIKFVHNYKIDLDRSFTPFLYTVHALT